MCAFTATESVYIKPTGIYCQECFPSWSSSSCLYQVCSARAKNQSHVQAHGSWRVCIHSHCQWTAMSYDRTLYQPRTSICWAESEISILTEPSLNAFPWKTWVLHILKKEDIKNMVDWNWRNVWWKWCQHIFGFIHWPGLIMWIGHR